MTEEDITAAKLRGYNCLIKFKDGEVLYLTIDKLKGDEDQVSEWLLEVERYINANHHHPFEYFPAEGVAMTRDTIKYIRAI